MTKTSKKLAIQDPATQVSIHLKKIESVPSLQIIVQSESTLHIDLLSKQNLLPSLDALKPQGGYLFLVRPQERGRGALLREGNPFQTMSFVTSVV